jgi:hypothetical protein
MIFLQLFGYSSHITPVTAPRSQRSRCSSPTFVWEPQEDFNPAAPNFG